MSQQPVKDNGQNASENDATGLPENAGASLPEINDKQIQSTSGQSEHNSADQTDSTELASAASSGVTRADLAGTVRPDLVGGDKGISFSTLLAVGARPRLVRWRRWLQTINEFEPQLRSETDASLKKRSLAIRYRAKSGESLRSLLPESYALVREAGRRALSMRHYDVQLVGGMALFEGCIAEMQTGEGKTLTATLPLYLHSLVGKGAHLATVNDYLAQRDADWMRPLFTLLGFTVGVIQTPDDQSARRKSYASDITYGTAKEFGFDFLRDRLLLRAQNRLGSEMLGDANSKFGQEGDQPVMRGMHYCLVDEADSILIDEARTPLIIGSLEDTVRDQIVETYRWAAENAAKFIEDEHFEIDHETKKFELTSRGRSLVRALPKPDLVRTMGLVDLYEYTERAAKVHKEFILDRQYVIRAGDKGDEIVIVDEFTGRLAEGRKWRDGIHQAIEAKEGIEISVPTGQAARITIQDLFLRYHHLSGMTGTAATSAGELKKIYRTPVIRVPTNRPPRRVRMPDMVFGTMIDKFREIVHETKQMNDLGRPVLIGTRSIDKSEILSRMLTEAGIEHEVLNANKVAEEAEIVARAGHHSKVTVATNMAGRGTDVKLAPGIEELGGMHVICTELHDAARIDRQLIGRCGRQGDSGSYRQYLSLDDDILKNGVGAEKALKYQRLGEESNGPFHAYAEMFRKAQRKVERKHFRDRMVLLHHEKERKKLQREIGQDPYLDTPD